MQEADTARQVEGRTNRQVDVEGQERKIMWIQLQGEHFHTKTRISHHLNLYP